MLRCRSRLKSLASMGFSLMLSVSFIYFADSHSSSIFVKIVCFSIGGFLGIVGLSEVISFICPSTNSLMISQKEIKWRGWFSFGKVRVDCLRSIEVIHSLESLGYIKLSLTSGETKKIPESCYGVFDSEIREAFKVVCSDVDISENTTLIH